MSETVAPVEKKPVQAPKPKIDSSEALQKQGDIPKDPNQGDPNSEPKEPAETPVVKKDPTAEFIESKPQLARYSMGQVFREFIVKNYSRFNGFKTKKDYEEAFSEFWGEKK